MNINVTAIGFILLLSGQVNAQQFDPFAEAEKTPKKSTNMSNLTASLDFIFQGTYIPELDLKQDNDFYDSQTTLDALIKYKASDDGLFQFRGIANHVAEKEGDLSESEFETTALEYFYRHSFANKSHFLTIGRKNLGWSAGFQWRPADVIDNGFTTRNFDSLDPSRFRGIDQIQYEKLGEAFDLSILASNHRHDFFGGNQYAVKLGIKGKVDTALLLAKNGNYSEKFGFVIDASLPWGTTFVMEAVQVNIDESYLLSPDYFGQTLESLSGINKYRDVYVGLTKFIDENQRANLEFFHNGRGFRKGQINDQIGESIGKYAALGYTDWEINSDIFSKEYLGRNYVYAAYTGYWQSHRVQIKPSVLINLDDNSYIASLTLKKAVTHKSELLLQATFYHEEEGTDLGEISPGVGINLSYLLHIF